MTDNISHPVVPENLADATVAQVRAWLIAYLHRSAADVADEVMGMVGRVLGAKDAALARALRQEGLIARSTGDQPGT